MRAHLMAIQGYDVDIFDFTSSRNTEKNSMIRAKRNPQVKTQVFLEEYHHIQTTFRLRPYLEELFEVRGSPVCAGKN